MPCEHHTWCLELTAKISWKLGMENRSIFFTKHNFKVLTLNTKSVIRSGLSKCCWILMQSSRRAALILVQRHCNSLQWGLLLPWLSAWAWKWDGCPNNLEKRKKKKKRQRATKTGSGEERENRRDYGRDEMPWCAYATCLNIWFFLSLFTVQIFKGATFSQKLVKKTN